MRIEFILLGATLLLALVHIFAAAGAKTRQYGTRWNMGPRDESLPPLDPVAGRLARAQANFYETLPLFIGALLGAAATGHLGWKTALGAHLYFWSRLVYLPVYAFGIPVLRSLIFMIGLAGLLLIVWAMLAG
ncbi:MAPEG family protein [Flavisphingomonas formosensis]|uniref:MAPEG family protein n=1 Tax=Flavisphingomonas formosensis TaxID=861534 RepID=UPI0012F92553|nr:MAPEG family protein [Sphingomonas formosensis]